MYKTAKFILNLLIFITGFVKLFADGTAGNKAAYETLIIVDCPTAGVLPKNSVGMRTVFSNYGTVSVNLSIAPWQDLNLGLSYSGNNIIGNGVMDFQGIPGFNVSYRMFNEKINSPALLIGINTQGSGSFYKNLDRFDNFSQGLYIVGSKNYTWANQWLAFHAGLSFSFEPKAKDRLPNVWFGIEQSVGPRISLNLEYNATINDNEAFTNKIGYLNTSLRLAVTKGTTIELQCRDLLKNSKLYKPFNRYFAIDFMGKY